MEYDITTTLGKYASDLASPSPAADDADTALPSEAHDAAAGLCELVGRQADLMEVHIAVAENSRWAVVRVAAVEKERD